MSVVRRTLIVTLIAAAACTSSKSRLEPAPFPATEMMKAERQIPPREPIPGTSAATSLQFSQDMTCAGVHVEVRHYYVEQERTLTVVAKSEAVFEIVSGRFDVMAPGIHGAHSSAVWKAEPGDVITVRTLSEHAVLRATYVIGR